MDFNNGRSGERLYLVNPKDLRFTHADINFAFTDTRHPSVRETASLLRYDRLSPNVFAPLHVCIDEQGNIWCDNNRRLFAVRNAGIDSIALVFDGTRRPAKPSLKSKLSDPNFMPRIRGEAPRVQISPPPTSGRNAYQMQKKPEVSLPGSVSTGYLNRQRQVYNSYEDELGDRFNQLHIKSTSTSEKMGFNTSCSAERRHLVNPKDLRFTHGDINHAFTDTRHPSVRQTASLLRYDRLSPNVLAPLHVNIDEQGNIWCDNNHRLFALRNADVDSIAVVFDGTRRPRNSSLKSELSNPSFMPRIRGEEPRIRIPPRLTSGRNASLPGSVSARCLNRKVCSSHEVKDEEDGLGALFSQLAIKSTSAGPKYPTHRESESSKQLGEDSSPFNLYHDYDYELYW